MGICKKCQHPLGENPMQIAVASLSSLPTYRVMDIPYVVSLPDPGTQVSAEMLPTSCRKLLQLSFHDLDDIEMLAPEYRKCTPPQLTHVETIARFFDQIGGNGDSGSILVHCEAGLSRSAASAIIGLTAMGYDDETAFRVITEANPLSLPNRRMLRMADSFFGHTSLRDMAEAHRIHQFELAGYEDPVKAIERNHGKSLRARISRLIEASTELLTGRKRAFREQWRKVMEARNAH